MTEQPKRYRLTHPQKRVWFTEKLHPGTGMWNVSGTLKLKGRIDYEALRQAVNIFIRENDAMRLRIGVEEGNPYQYLSDFKPVKIDYLDFSDRELKSLYEWDSVQTQAPLPLIDSDLFHFTMIRLADDEAWLYVKFHHLVCDGLSLVDFGNQVTEIYQSLLTGEVRESQRRSYIEYIREEEEYLNSKRFQSDRQYWMDKFAEPAEPTVLKQKKTNYTGTKAKRKTFVMPSKLSAQARKFCLEFGVSAFSLYFAVLAVYINRVTGRKDLTIGVPVANRTSLHSKGSIGMFVSTVPVRIKLSDDMRFSDFLRAVSNQWLSVLKHQKYPYEVLVQELRKTHKGLDSLYDITLSLQSGKFEKKTELFTFEGRWHFGGAQTNSLSIHLNDREDNGKFIIDYDYQTPFYSEKEIEYLHAHLMNIIEDAVSAPDKPVFGLRLMSDEERGRVISAFNKTEHSFPQGETLCDLWYKMLAETAKDDTAAVCGGRRLTYGELEERSCALALRLKKQGIGAESIVGLLVTRSFDYCVGVLAILKAGGAFLPIDPELPDERILYMLEDSGAKALIVSPPLESKCAGTKASVIRTDEDFPPPGEQRIDPGCGPQNLAYVIYTSGSTGQPKGVMIEHASAVHFVYSLREVWKLGKGLKMLCAASFSFDMSIMEFLPAILSGTLVVLAREHEVNIPKNMARLIKSEGVNMFMVTPGRMELLLSDNLGAECLKDFRSVSMGGDVLPEELLAKVKQFTAARIFNFYGPTEITVCATCTELSNSKVPNIGRPMFNVKAYILDKHMNPVPIGVPGELYIGGPGVSRGYINRPELNAERFVESPFIPGQRLYRTGDLTRWYPFGEIEFLGRIDKQVKIRGYRIELGEIENRLMRIQGVVSCAVADRTDASGRKYLCAYITGNPPKKAQIKAQLMRDLPAYMIPSYFVTLESLPLNASGKVDRESLPDPLAGAEEDERVAPETATERILADIWSDVLNTQGIGRYDSFFDIGGDSLSVVSVMSRVAQQFHVEISLEEVYRSPRLADFAALIDSAKQSAYRPILPLPPARDYPVSSAQQRMWVLSREHPQSTAYNVPVAIEVRGRVNIKKLRRAFKELIDRHEILRTSYTLRKGELRQKINKRYSFELENIRCGEKELKKTLRGLIRPFDLEKAPVIRAALVRTESSRGVLLIDMHHIAGDMRTTEILLRDLGLLYSGRTLPPKYIEYKDYASWQREAMSSEEISIQRDYWKYALSGELPLLNLHTDKPRPAVMKFSGADARFELKGRALEGLRSLARRKGATMFTALLSVYNVLLSKYTGQEDIIVGTPVSGRKREELNDIAGMFLNSVPLRNFPKDDLRFGEFFDELNKNFAAAFAHSEYPLERMIADLSVPRDASRNPLFDTMLVYAKNEFDFGLEGTKCRIYPLNTKTAKFDLTLEAYEEGDALKCRFEYNTRLFKRSTVKRMIGHLRRLAEILPEEPDVRLGDVQMMTQSEIWQVTQGFNQTDHPLDPKKTIQSIFEDVVEKYPEKAALIVSGESMTFAELNKRANKTARWLREKGIGRNSIVALCMHRSMDLMAALLGVLKAGGAFLPVDPEYPEERIRFMLSDSGAKFVITDEGADMPACGAAHTLREVPQDTPDGNLMPVESMEDAAYVIYTSGSTGIPKGVVLPRRGLCSLYESMKSMIGYRVEDICISMATISFDMFIGEALMPLLFGCSIAMCTDEEMRQPHLLASLIESVKASFIQTTPTRMQIMMSDRSFRSAASKHIKKILLGGEIFSISLLKLLRKYTKAKIYNGYGPTETSVYSTYQELTDTLQISIGRPVKNAHVYILDRNLRPVPVGVLGEAYISGIGVSVRGYINRDELNRSKFLPDPFRPGHTMYRTGDVCAFLENGEIEMCGRADHQVKIRGLRIELGEIEAAIREVKGVEEAVVKDWGEGADKYLCAYYKSADGVSAETLRQHLSKKLPVYMVPSVFVAMKEMPSTLSGKTDRKALPEPKNHGAPEKSASTRAGMTNTEKKMARVWERVLKTNGIGPDDDFFELGGDSLGVIKVQSAVFQYGWSIRTKDFYEGRTLREICERMNKNETVPESAKSKERRVYIPEFEHLRPVPLKSVFLTGATGYLGAHLLERLTRSPGTRAYCLVRGADDEKCEKRLRDTMLFYFGAEICSRILKRAAVIRGNIAEPDFGLGGDVISQIRAGALIHCAALTDHIGSAEAFYSTNVLGTKHAVGLAKALDLALIHVSTCSVSGKYYIIDRERTGEFDERCLYIGQDYSFNEYVKSKYEAERIVYGAIKKGLNARIFRVGLLTGTTDGRFQARPERNAFANRIKALCDLGFVPAGALQTEIELTPVDCCAEAILILSVTDTRNPVFHVYNDNKITLRDIVSMLKENGYAIDEIADEEFRRRIRQISAKGDPDRLTGLINDINDGGEARVKVTNAFTARRLMEAGFRWPAIDSGYLGRFLNSIGDRQYKEV